MLLVTVEYAMKLGTGMSIMISRRNPSLVTTFALLSCGYVFSSYQEVKSVELHTLNRARFTVAVDSFLKTGRVPSLREGNLNENIFSFPWLKDRPVVLGPRFNDAFQDPGEYLAIEPLFEKERYIVTYNPSKGKVYALLKDRAKSDDILKAAFHAHVLLHFVQSSNESQSSSQKQREYNNYSDIVLTTTDLEAHMSESCKMVSKSYGIFKSKAAEQGWKMCSTTPSTCTASDTADKEGIIENMLKAWLSIEVEKNKEQCRESKMKHH
nr:protein root uvb sensitive 6 [Quercus suber]